MVRALASHQCGDSGSNSRLHVICGLSLLQTVSTSLFNKIERMLKKMLEPFAHALSTSKRRNKFLFISDFTRKFIFIALISTICTNFTILHSVWDKVTYSQPINTLKFLHVYYYDTGYQLFFDIKHGSHT